MHFLTSLIIFVSFAFVVLVGLVSVISELSKWRIHESPVIPEAFNEFAVKKTYCTDTTRSSRERVGGKVVT